MKAHLVRGVGIVGVVGLIALGIAPPAAQRAVDTSAAPHATETNAAAPTQAARAAREAYSRLPLSFEENRGQTDGRVDFLVRGNGYTLFLTPGEAVFAARAQAAPTTRDAMQVKKDSATVVRMKIVGANPQAQASGLLELPGTVNYFRGNDPAQWRTAIPTYNKIRYSGVYPGVDLLYYGNQRHLEYDFVVAPGADPGVIMLAFDGVDAVTVDEKGDLVLRTASGEMRQPKPVIYQEMEGTRHEIEGGYELMDTHRIAFRTGTYDAAHPLVIDPVIAYSTFLGGTNGDGTQGIAIDSAGSAYIAGQTSSSNFPVSPGAFDPMFNAGVFSDAFVAKLNPTGTALVYSTYLGGSDHDAAKNMAIDGNGHVYVTGWTYSANFPVTLGAFDVTYNGGFRDAFVTKLNRTGTALVYSTYLGSPDGEEGYGVAVDMAGYAYVTGWTGSMNFPTTLGAFDVTHNGGSADAFVAKLHPSGSSLAYSTYLGGTGFEEAQDIAVDPGGYAYVTGSTSSIDFPTVPGSFDVTHNGGVWDVFITKLKPTGTGLVYSSFVGGTGHDAGFGIAVDAWGHAAVTGWTESTNFPTSAWAFDSTHNGGRDTFVTKLFRTGNSLVFSTYVGGSSDETGIDVAVDPNGHAFVTGWTQSTDFPVTPLALGPTLGGSIDAFVVRLNGGPFLIYSSYLGGGSTDAGEGIAVDRQSTAYVTGWTRSLDFPATPTVVQPTNSGAADAFVTKITQ